MHMKDAANIQHPLQSITGLLIFCPNAAVRSGLVWCKTFSTMPSLYKFDVRNVLASSWNDKK